MHTEGRHHSSSFTEMYLNSSFISESHETVLVSDGHGLMFQHSVVLDGLLNSRGQYVERLDLLSCYNFALT